jgi:UDP-glucuronate decarboxylase
LITKTISEDVSNILFNLPNLKNIEGKKILITGANGFLPSYIVDCLIELNKSLENPCPLILLSKNPVTEKSRLGHLIGNENITFMAQDVGKSFTLPSGIDIIIHAASRATPSSNLEDPLDTIDANIMGLRTLLDYAKKNKVEEFLFFSSAEIYGNPSSDNVPTPESYYGNVNPIDKRASYAESKRLGETMCMDFYRKFNTPVKLLRIFNIYGPGLRNDGKVISEFFLKSFNEKKIEIKSAGDAKRSFCYISDAITQIFSVLLNGKIGEAYNIGDDSNNVSIKQLAHLIKDIVNNETIVEVNSRAKNFDGPGIPTRYPDISKINSLGFTPQLSLNMGLSRLKKWYDETRNDSQGLPVLQ